MHGHMLRTSLVLSKLAGARMMPVKNDDDADTAADDGGSDGTTPGKFNMKEKMKNILSLFEILGLLTSLPLMGLGAMSVFKNVAIQWTCGRCDSPRNARKLRLTDP